MQAEENPELYEEYHKIQYSTTQSSSQWLASNQKLIGKQIAGIYDSWIEEN